MVTLMLRSLALLGIGYPIFMLLLGLFLQLFPGFAYRGREFLSLGGIIRSVQAGLIMGFLWGLLMISLDIFLFTKTIQKKED